MKKLIVAGVLVIGALVGFVVHAEEVSTSSDQGITASDSNSKSQGNNVGNCMWPFC